MCQILPTIVTLPHWGLRCRCCQLSLALSGIRLKEIFVELRIVSGLLLLEEATLTLVLVRGESLHHLFDLRDLDVTLGNGRRYNLSNCCRLPFSR